MPASLFEDANYEPAKSIPTIFHPLLAVGENPISEMAKYLQTSLSVALKISLYQLPDCNLYIYKTDQLL